jgi:hypothetical protein
MLKNIVAVVIGTFVWFALAFLIMALSIRGSDGLVAVPLLFVAAIVVGFVTASIVEENKFTIAIVAVLLPYVLMMLLSSKLLAMRNTLSPIAFMLSLGLGVIIQSVLAAFGAYLSKLICKGRKNNDDIE